MLISLCTFFILFFTIGGFIINKNYNAEVKKSPMMYCYQTYYGPANSVLIIENLKYKNDYINYYSLVSKGENPTFNFPLKTMPQHTPVYVISYTKDSLLAEVVSYYDRGVKFGGSFTKGWVYAETLHKEPPP